MSGVITEGGERLRAFLDGTHVETEWIANYHVVWQTGQRNGPAQGDPAHHTHCSAYVAAAALRRPLHGDKARSLKVLDEPLGDKTPTSAHRRFVHALPAIEAKPESARIRKVVRPMRA